MKYYAPELTDLAIEKISSYIDNLYVLLPDDVLIVEVDKKYNFYHTIWEDGSIMVCGSDDRTIELSVVFDFDINSGQAYINTYSQYVYCDKLAPENSKAKEFFLQNFNKHIVTDIFVKPLLSDNIINLMQRISINDFKYKPKWGLQEECIKTLKEFYKYFLDDTFCRNESILE